MKLDIRILNKKIIVSRSLQETKKLGESIAHNLKPADIIALFGELGSGKTSLVQGIAKGLGIKRWVASPTFSIVNVYALSKESTIETLYHVDLFRIANVKELEEIGIEEFMYSNGVTVIEWADRLGRLMPKDCIDIKIDVLNECSRKFTIKGIF